MSKPVEINWLEAPEEEDYEHSLDYLSLIYEPKDAAVLVRALRVAPMVSVRAKNVLRAAYVSPLLLTNTHIQDNLKKIEAGKALVPVLLVRDHYNHRLLVAEGWHRVCAAYYHSEDSTIRCKIV